MTNSIEVLYCKNDKKRRKKRSYVVLICTGRNAPRNAPISAFLVGQGHGPLCSETWVRSTLYDEREPSCCRCSSDGMYATFGEPGRGPGGHGLCRAGCVALACVALACVARSVGEASPWKKVWGGGG